MKVTLDRTFPLPGAPAAGWAVLSDIEAVASCMPGAKITERVDERHYKGTVTVKVGPATLAFKGEIDVQQLEPSTRTLRLVAKGIDASGSSAASLDLTARIDDAQDGASSLVGHSESTVSGKAVTFGGRMMDAVADQVLKQFAANFTAHVQAAAAQATPAATTAPPRDAAATVANETPVSAPKPLNGMALVWAIVRDWLRALFAKKAA